MPSCSPRHILILTKPVVLILVWITLSVMIFYSALQSWPHIFQHIDRKLWVQVFISSSIATVYGLFLVSGFLGDVYFGRYWAVVIGITLITVSTVPTSIGGFLYFEKGKLSAPFETIAKIVLVASFLLLVMGYSLFSSNILQFGMDQLIEKPSEKVGVFAHWQMWAFNLASSLPIVLFALNYCDSNELGKIFHKFIYALPLCFVILFTMSLLLGYHIRHHFNRDRVKYNPYKMIFKVLNFARKNKYPVGPVSAFAHCYDYRPSRLDYAKERYGGPFTTSDVEDVKAFKNVFLVLLALGPVFVLGPATGYLQFKTFTHHTGASLSFGLQNKTCENYVDIAFEGLATYIALPIYMWIMYSMLRDRRPKILHRLGAASIIYVLAVVGMLGIDFAGHIILYTQQNHTRALCMFVDESHHHPHRTLEFHWGVVAIISFMKGFSLNVVFATSFELISAQSPHTMKGVLVGSFFAIVGIFNVIGAIFLLPFSLNGIWKHGYLGHHPPVVSCGFGYYLVCITVAVIGFISFIVAVKRYKYRRRDEEPYSQACVEEIFARRIAGDLQHRDREGYEELSGLNEY